MPISSEKIASDFRALLDEVLNSKKLIDKAVYGRESITLKGQKISLTDADKLGVFNKDGSQNKERCKLIGVEIDVSRVSIAAEKYGFSNVSIREQCILDSAIFEARGRLQILNMHYLENIRNLENILTYPQPIQEPLLLEFRDNIQNVPTEIIKQLAPLKLTSPNSYTALPEVRKKLKGGFFNFSETNIHISPGPSNKHEIANFLDNLLNNKIKHVFAIGRLYSYHPQDGRKKDRPIHNEFVLAKDFINYFIPDINGKVVLPSGLEGHSVESKLVEKVGRITTYAVSINGSKPIYVHNYPLRDKQPLELTEDELNYVRLIQARTAPEENILTHCRGGKGRSAQLAYVLASSHEKYSSIHKVHQLKLMRKEITGHEDSRNFVETPFQEGYISSLILKAPRNYKKDKDTAGFLETYQLITLIFEEEFKRLDVRYENLDDKIAEHNGFLSTSSLSKELQQYVKLLGLYYALSEKEGLSQLIGVLKEAQKLTIVSELFKAVLIKDNADLLLDYLVQKIKEEVQYKPLINHKALFDLAAGRFGFYELFLALQNKEKHYGPEWQIIKVYIAQAYLRQYRSFDKEKQSEHAITILGFLKNNVEDLFKSFAQALQSSGSERWEETSQLFQAIKELAMLYTSQIAPNKELEQKIATLAEVVKLGTSANFTVVGGKIELSKGTPIIETIPTSSQVKENLDKLKLAYEMYEAGKFLIDETGLQKDTHTYVQEIHDILSENFNNEVEKANAFIKENIEIFNGYLWAIKNIDSTLSKDDARQQIHRLWTETCQKIYGRYDQKEPLAQGFYKEATKTATDRNDSERNKNMQRRTEEKRKAVVDSAFALIGLEKKGLDTTYSENGFIKAITDYLKGPTIGTEINLKDYLIKAKHKYQENYKSELDILLLQISLAGFKFSNEHEQLLKPHIKSNLLASLIDNQKELDKLYNDLKSNLDMFFNKVKRNEYAQVYECVSKINRSLISILDLVNKENSAEIKVPMLNSLLKNKANQPHDLIDLEFFLQQIEASYLLIDNFHIEWTITTINALVNSKDNPVSETEHDVIAKRELYSLKHAVEIFKTLDENIDATKVDQLIGDIDKSFLTKNDNEAYISYLSKAKSLINGGKKTKVFDKIDNYMCLVNLNVLIEQLILSALLRAPLSAVKDKTDNKKPLGAYLRNLELLQKEISGYITSGNLPRNIVQFQCRLEGIISSSIYGAELSPEYKNFMKKQLTHAQSFMAISDLTVVFKSEAASIHQHVEDNSLTSQTPSGKLLQNTEKKLCVLGKKATDKLHYFYQEGKLLEPEHFDKIASSTKDIASYNSLADERLEKTLMENSGDADTLKKVIDNICSTIKKSLNSLYKKSHMGLFGSPKLIEPLEETRRRINFIKFNNCFTFTAAPRL